MLVIQNTHSLLPNTEIIQPATDERTLNINESVLYFFLICSKNPGLTTLKLLLL